MGKFRLNAMENYRKIWACVSALALFLLPFHICSAQSYEDVTMSVGETKTLYLPSSVTTKNLKSVTFYSNGISYV